MTNPNRGNVEATGAEFTDDEIQRRPFAVGLGYVNWAENAGLIASTAMGSVGQLDRDGLLEKDEGKVALSVATEIVREISEYGHDERLRGIPDVEVAGLSLLRKDKQLLSSSFYDWYNELNTRTLDAIAERVTMPANVDKDARVDALVKLHTSLYQVASRAYLWGRTDSQYFLTMTDGRPTTVRHHEGLLTTDWDTENARLNSMFGNDQEGHEPIGIPPATKTERIVEAYSRLPLPGSSAAGRRALGLALDRFCAGDTLETEAIELVRAKLRREPHDL